MAPEAFNCINNKIWNSQNEQTKDHTIVAFSRVNDEHMRMFKNHVRPILMC